MNFIQKKKVFSENKNLFKSYSTVFKLKELQLKTHHFHTNTPNQKPIRIHIKWEVQDGPKKRKFDTTAFSFLKISVQQPLKNS